MSLSLNCIFKFVKIKQRNCIQFKYYKSEFNICHYYFVIAKLFIHSFIHSLVRSLSRSLNHSFILSFLRSFIHSIIHLHSSPAFICSFTHLHSLLPTAGKSNRVRLCFNNAYQCNSCSVFVGDFLQNWVI